MRLVGFVLLVSAEWGCGKDGASVADLAKDGGPDAAPLAGGGTGGIASTGGAGGQGGISSSGGSSGAGGASSSDAGLDVATGGGKGTGGAAGSGGGSGAAIGTSASGGVIATGGSVAFGGMPGLGGATGRGGVSGSAGIVAMGGNPGSGGSSGSGGLLASGGRSSDGGVPDSGSDAGTKLASDSLAVRFANAVLSRWPDPSNITATVGWEYNHGIVLRGIEQVYRHTSDARYLAYIKKYADANVSDSGAITLPSAHSFDNIQPSVLLPFLFQQTGSAKYQTASNTIRARYDTIPRNADKGFWHKQTYPNQMWLDSIYMGMPFLARHGAVFGTCGTFCGDTVVEQVSLIAQHVRDATTGLLYHAWDDSAAGQKAAWADVTTGRSPVVWGRALGWYAMALVDLLGDLPAGQSGRSEMLTILGSLAAGLKTTQDSATGLWFQVVDQGSKSDDWLETSASGMFVYALKVAVDRGYIDASYLDVANQGWKGLQTKVTSDATGPVINGAVQGMGVQTDYAGYINQTALSNSPHGLCAILLAASEMEAR